MILRNPSMLDRSSRKLSFHGNNRLLDKPLNALLCSRACPGAKIIEAMDLAQRWRGEIRAVISGFQTAVEKEGLRIFRAARSPSSFAPPADLIHSSYRPSGSQSSSGESYYHKAIRFRDPPSNERNRRNPQPPGHRPRHPSHDHSRHARWRARPLNGHTNSSLRHRAGKSPFGKISSVTIVNEAGETSKESLIINRDDFWASTSKCEPHWHTAHFPPAHLHHLKQHGRGAVVFPDNVDSSRPLVGLCPALRAVHVAPLPSGSIVLFEGGAGECLRGRAILNVRSSGVWLVISLKFSE